MDYATIAFSERCDTVSYEYDNVPLDVVKGGAFLESTTISAARPRSLHQVKYSFGLCKMAHEFSMMSCSVDADNLSPWLIQRPWHVTDSPPLSGAKVKNEWNCSPSPPLIHLLVFQ